MARIQEAPSAQDFDKIITDAAGKLAVVHFWAAWAPQCQQMDNVMTELAKDTQNIHVKFVKVEAEAVPEVSQRYEVMAVPTCILIKNKKVLDRVNGANAAELTNKTSQHREASPASAAPQSKEDLNSRLKKIINKAPVVLFMKGNPQEPRCGFSKTTIGLLNNHNVDYDHFDILSDEEVRQGLKAYSNWPTYPQLYVNGELLGGLDILKELDEGGELESMLPKKQSLEDRLKALVKQDEVMVFMKGSPDQAKCGFSRQLMEILKPIGVDFGHFDILSDDEVRQGLKKFSNWPTFPQVYVKGELVGGLDIIKELQESGELQSTLKGE